MKQSEKLDLILRALYKHKNDGNYHEIENILETQNIPFEPHNEVRMLAHRLEDEGYINTQFTQRETFALLTSYGIEYCEENSYSYKGHSLITNTYNSISNSPNANIVSSSNNVSIQINNYPEIKSKITEIREAISKSADISKTQKQDLIDCLEDVETSIDAGKKPKFSFKQLVEQTSNLAGVGSLLLDLGKLIFGE